MQTIGYVLGWLLGGLSVMAMGLLALAGKSLSWLFRRVFAFGASTALQVKRGRPAAKQEVACVRVETPAQDVQEDAGPETILMEDRFDIADRIVSIRLEPTGANAAVGVVNLRVYNKLAVVRRDLIISEPQLAALMRGRRHSLPEVAYDPVQGLDNTKEATIQEVEKLINELGNGSVRAKRPQKDDFKRDAPAPKPAAEVPAVALQPAPAPTRAAKAPTTAVAPAHAPAAPVGGGVKTVVPTVTKGFTYVGELVRAGPQVVRPANRTPYEIFEAALRLDNGAELPLRGAELERELVASGCEIGQRVAITPMGKVPVDLGGDKVGQKNLYRVARMGA